MRLRVCVVVMGLLVLALVGLVEAVPLDARLSPPPGLPTGGRSGASGSQAYSLPQLPSQSGGLVLGAPEYRYVTSDVAGSHTTTAGVPAFGVNVDGVVSVWGPEWMGSGALISDTHILTAGHLEPTAGFDVQFQPATGDVWMTTAAGKMHPCYLPSSLSAYGVLTGFDVSVATLTSPAPAAAPRYELYTGSGDIGVSTVKSGYGGTGHGSTGATTSDYLKRAGLNLYDTTAENGMALFGWYPLQPGAYLSYDFDSGLSDNDAYGYVGLPHLGYGADEVGSAGGDSGGPTFVLDGGVYKIAGVTSWGVGFDGLPDANPSNGSSWGELAADSRVASYTNFIQSVVSGVPMDGGFKNEYSPGLWSSYDEAGGTVDWSEAPYRLRLYGGDAGVGGVTLADTFIAADGTVSFDWNYGSTDEYGWDAFGYLINGIFYDLTWGLHQDSYTGEWTDIFGSVSVPVNAGDEFGFFMYTADGQFGAGVANVWNFSAPRAETAIPEPTTLTALSLLGLCSAIARRRSRRKSAA